VNAIGNINFANSTAGSASGNWAFNGTNSTITFNASVSLGSLSGTATGSTFTNGVTTSTMLTIGGVAGSTTFSGVIGSTLALVKTGNSVLVLNGNNTYTGTITTSDTNISPFNLTTQIVGGTLVGGSNNAFGAGPIGLGNGTSSSANVVVGVTSGANIAAGLIALAGNSFTQTLAGVGLAGSTWSGGITLNHDFHVTQISTTSSGLTLAGIISGGTSNTLFVDSGPVRITGANGLSFSGPVRVGVTGGIPGQLIANGVSSTGSGTLTVLPGAALGGNGTLTGKTFIGVSAGTVTTNLLGSSIAGAFAGIIQPGNNNDAPGTLTFASPLTLTANGSAVSGYLALDETDPFGGPSDLVTFTGAGSTLDLTKPIAVHFFAANSAGADYAFNGTYLIMSGLSVINGVGAGVTSQVTAVGLPSGSASFGTISLGSGTIGIVGTITNSNQTYARWKIASGGSWDNNTTNWVGNIVPATAGSIAEFTATVAPGTVFLSQATQSSTALATTITALNLNSTASGTNFGWAVGGGRGTVTLAAVNGRTPTIFDSGNNIINATSMAMNAATTIQVSGTASILRIDSLISGALATSSLTITGQGTVALTGAATYAGSTTVGSGATFQVGPGSFNSISHGVANAGQFSINYTQAYDLQQSLITGAGTLTNSGTGAMSLIDNASLSASQLRITGGGSVKPNFDNILTSSNNLTIASGLFDLSGHTMSQGIGAIVIGTGTTFSASTLTLNSGSINNGTNPAFTSIAINNGGVFDLAGGAINSTAITTNGITINAGGLMVFHGGVFGTDGTNPGLGTTANGGITINGTTATLPGGTLDISGGYIGGGSAQIIAGQTGGQLVSLPTGSITGGTVNFGANTSYTFSADLSGTMTILKSGTANINFPGKVNVTGGTTTLGGGGRFTISGAGTQYMGSVIVTEINQGLIIAGNTNLASDILVGTGQGANDFIGVTGTNVTATFSGNIGYVTSVPNTSEMRIGNFANTTGGSMILTGNTTIPNTATGGPTAYVANNIIVLSGTGSILDQSDGAIVKALNLGGEGAATTFTINQTASLLSSATSTGVVSIQLLGGTGGQATNVNIADTATVRVGSTGQGLLNMYGTAPTATGAVNLNLNGGNVFVGTIIQTSTVGSFLNMNGGTITAGLDGDILPAGSLTATTVRALAGGGNFNLNGKNVTISKTIVGSATDGGLTFFTTAGASTITLTSTQSSYGGPTTIATNVIMPLADANVLGNASGKLTFKGGSVVLTGDVSFAKVLSSTNAAQVITDAGNVGGVTHRWSFNNGDANDSIGSANGTVTGAVSYTNGAALFDGAAGDGTRINLPISISDDTNAVNVNSYLGGKSFAVWYNETVGTTNGNRKVLAFSGQIGPQGTPTSYFMLTPDLNNTTQTGIEYSNNGNGGGTVRVLSTSKPSSGDFHLLVATLDAGNTTLTVYIDGVSIGTGNVSALNTGGFTGSAFIGGSAWNGDNSFNGLIDDVALYATALSADDVAKLYNVGQNYTVTAPAVTSITQQRLIAVGAGGGVLDFGAGHALTSVGGITDQSNLSSTLTLVGSGTLGLVGNSGANLVIPSSIPVIVGSGNAAGAFTAGNVKVDSLIQIDHNAASSVWRANLSGTGSITQTGTGTTTLAGTNTFSGGVLVPSGKLIFNNASGQGLGSGLVIIGSATSNAVLGGVGYSSAPIEVMSGSILAPGPNNSTPGTLHASNLTLDNGAEIDFDLTSFVPGQYDTIDLLGAGSNFNLGNVTYKLFNSGATSSYLYNGQYTLITGITASTGSFTNLTLVGGASGVNYNLTKSGNSIILTISNGVNYGNWVADTNSNWDDSVNWTAGLVPNATGSAAVFGAILTGARTVTLTGSRTVGLLSVSGTQSYTFIGGPLVLADDSSGIGSIQVTNSHTIAADINAAGTVSITLNNPSVLTLSGNLNAATRNLVINGGNNTTMVLAGPSASYNDATINGGILQIGNSGTQGSLGSGSVILNGGSLVLQRSDNLVVSNSIVGNGSVRQAGTGTVTIATAMALTGDVTVISGVLKGGITDALGGANLNVTGGKFDLNGFSQTVGPITLPAGATIDNSGASPVTLTMNQNVNATFAGSILNTGSPLSIVKNGTGNVSITGNMAYTGTTTLTDGRFTLNTTVPAMLGSVIIMDGAVNAQPLQFGSNNSVLTSDIRVGTAQGTLTMFTLANANTVATFAGGLTMDLAHGQNNSEIRFGAGGADRTLVLAGATVLQNGDGSILPAGGVAMGFTSGNIILSGTGSINDQASVQPFITGGVNIAGNNPLVFTINQSGSLLTSVIAGTTALQMGTTQNNNTQTFAITDNALVRLGINGDANFDINANGTSSAATNFNLNGGKMQIGAFTRTNATAGAANVNLNGGTLTFGGPNNTDIMPLSLGTASNFTATGSGSTLNFNNHVYAINHAIAGTGTLTISGGTLQNSGPFTFGGKLAAGTGAVIIANSSDQFGASTPTFNGGIIRLSGNVDFTAPVSTGNTTLFASNLTHAYTFNDGTAKDGIGHADGTIVNATIANGVAAFNGAGVGGSRITLPVSTTDDVNALNVGSYTDKSFVMWVTQLADTNTFSRFLGFGSNAGAPADANVWSMYFGGGNITNRFWNAGYQTVPDTIGQLGMLAVTFTGQTENVYYVTPSGTATILNYATTAAAWPTIWQGGAWIGGVPFGNNSMNGTIDDYRIYNTALSAADVATLFATGTNNGLAPATPIRNLQVNANGYPRPRRQFDGRPGQYHRFLQRCRYPHHD